MKRVKKKKKSESGKISGHLSVALMLPSGKTIDQKPWCQKDFQGCLRQSEVIFTPLPSLVKRRDMDKLYVPLMSSVVYHASVLWKRKNTHGGIVSSSLMHHILLWWKFITAFSSYSHTWSLSFFSMVIINK